MNILTDELPETVEIDGRAVPINTDFRACLQVVLAFEDPDLTPQEKQTVMLTNLYPTLPKNPAAALAAAELFLNGGQPADPAIEGAALYYSFSKDARLIFAAFRQVHGIDLQTAKLHWWKFCSLFVGLFGSETPFASLVGLRQRVRTGTASKEERAAARAMGAAFDVPEFDDRTLEEKEQERVFLQMVGEGAAK